MAVSFLLDVDIVSVVNAILTKEKLQSTKGAGWKIFFKLVVSSKKAVFGTLGMTSTARVNVEELSGKVYCIKSYVGSGGRLFEKLINPINGLGYIKVLVQKSAFWLLTEVEENERFKQILTANSKEKESSVGKLREIIGKFVNNLDEKKKGQIHLPHEMSEQMFDEREKKRICTE